MQEVKKLSSFEKYKNKVDLIEELREKFTITEHQLGYFCDQDIYHSTHLEGNTLTREEITVFLESGVTVHGKPLRDFLQVRGYSKILEWLKGSLRCDNVLSIMFIKTLHRVITFGELQDEYSGHFRDDFVTLRTTGYIPPHHSEVEQLLEKEIEKYYVESADTQFEKICSFHRAFERIHPFFDGNGRTGRVVMNFLFLQNGYPYMIIDFDHRVEYFESLEQDTFTEFATERMLESFSILEKLSK